MPLDGASSDNNVRLDGDINAGTAVLTWRGLRADVALNAGWLERVLQQLREWGANVQEAHDADN